MVLDCFSGNGAGIMEIILIKDKINVAKYISTRLKSNEMVY